MASSSASDGVTAGGATDPSITFRNALHWDGAVPSPAWARLMINDAYQDKNGQVRAAARHLIKVTKEKEALWNHLCKLEANPEVGEQVAAHDSEYFRRAGLATPPTSEAETIVGQGNSPHTVAGPDAADWGESAEDVEFDRELDEAIVRADDEARAALATARAISRNKRARE